MESFLIELKSKNNKDIIVCGICVAGFKNLAIDAYKKGISSAIVEETTDIYLLDISLNKIVVDSSIKEVLAVGASISVMNLPFISGGIIGDPKSKEESAQENIDYLGNNLYCIAFSGKYGAVFKGNLDFAQKVLKIFESSIFFKNEQGCKLVIDFLKAHCELFIVIADGSGEGSFFYGYCFGP